MELSYHRSLELQAVTLCTDLSPVIGDTILLERADRLRQGVTLLTFVRAPFTHALSNDPLGEPRFIGLENRLGARDASREHRRSPGVRLQWPDEWHRP
jgi:hypothetical protein